MTHPAIIRFHRLFVATALAGLLTACGGGSDTDVAELEVIDNTEEVKAYYAAKPEFFSFKTLADIPTDLTWQDGSHLPDIGSPEAKKGGTEYMYIQDFPRTLRQVGPDSNGSFRPFLLDYTTMQLGHRHPNEFEYHPGLAERWAVDRPNKTIYVKLNSAATWSDGEAITSDDYLFMFFFFQSDYIVAPWYKNWYSTQYLNITKYDDLHFSITIPEAKPDMDARVLELRPIPQHFYKELGDDFVERFQWKFQPTTGPYVIHDKDIKKGQSVALTRNDNWWAKDLKFFRNRYNPDRLHISVIRDTAKGFEAFKRGDIDQLGLYRSITSEYWYDKLPDQDSDVQNGYIQKSVFYNQHPRATIGLWINSHKPLLNNRDVRVGIQYATNWQVVIDRFFRGDNVRMQTSSDGYGEFTHPTLTSRDFDIDKAQEYFAKAGFVERGPDGIKVNEQGERLSFTLTTGYERLKDVLTILKEEASKAGLEFRVEVLDNTAGWKKVQEKKHDIQLSGLSVGLEMYPRFWDTYHSDNAYDGGAFLEDGSVNPERTVKTQTNNLEMFAMPEMDKMIDAYRASEDKEEMKQLAFDMTQLHHDYASFVPGYYTPFYRVGHWRWIRYPDDFNVKHSRSAGEFHVHWIDTELKEKTLEARKNGESLSTEIKVFDQYQ